MMNKTNKIIAIDKRMMVTIGEEGRGRAKRVKEVKYTATEEHWALGGEGTINYTDALL